jgi:hypothetical protein
MIWDLITRNYAGSLVIPKNRSNFEEKAMKRKSTGQFMPTPEGEKTSKMLEVEAYLGRTLEEDYHEYYIEKKWGQKKMANRWKVARGLIFGLNKRGGRRSWVQMLDLPIRNETEVEDRKADSISQPECEICGESETVLDNAHWVSDSNGGKSSSFNILHLCPNCHRKLDRMDSITTEKARQTLLFREVRKIIESGGDMVAKQKKLVRICEGIVNRTPL